MTCQKCSALCTSRTQIVEPDLPEFGRPCKVLVVGEAPGADEDTQGKGFVGRAGRTLHALLEEHGLRRGFDYGCANIVRCRPPENRRPTKTEIGNCLPYLAEILSRSKPRAVLAIGGTAARVFMGKSGLRESMDRLHHADQCPRRFLGYGSILDMKWPYKTNLFIMPHTSPLAWNRNAPDGRKWSEIGREQVRLMAERLRPC